jgi:threonine synthase
MKAMNVDTTLIERHVIRLECTSCRQNFSPENLYSLCSACGGILDPIYDLDLISDRFHREHKSVLRGMWRWFPFLPVRDAHAIIDVGEGDTPLFLANHLGELMGVKKIYVKDETKNPTGTFKDRGASSTISKICEHKVTNVALASEGNAACSFALYSLLAGISCHAYVPDDASVTKKELTRFLGAELTVFGRTLLESSQLAKREISLNHWYDCSTFVTPYRHDGKGTMALEICDQLNWTAPDVIVYPTGGGVGLVGMWKTLKMIKELGWIEKLPRIVAVQPEGCSPVVAACQKHASDVELWNNPNTLATGLRIPKPLGGKLILNAIYEFNGLAVAVSEQDILDAQRRLLSKEGLLLEPSSSAAFAAIPMILSEGYADREETIVVIATGSGLKTLTNPE